MGTMGTVATTSAKQFAQDVDGPTCLPQLVRAGSWMRKVNIGLSVELCYYQCRSLCDVEGIKG